MPKTKKIQSIEPSSGNVFADLDRPRAEEKHTKVHLAFVLNEMIREKGLHQTAAAKALRVSQPKISALAHYQLAGFSVARLLGFLNALDCDVEILIRKRPRSSKGGTVSVSQRTA
jgi:predicted XRE-type DNA-binding protein